MEEAWSALAGSASEGELIASVSRAAAVLPVELQKALAQQAVIAPRPSNPIRSLLPLDTLDYTLNEVILFALFEAKVEEGLRLRWPMAIRVRGYCLPFAVPRFSFRGEAEKEVEIFLVWAAELSMMSCFTSFMSMPL
ncbi:hypothetical protein MIND_00408200 [Mycena indigotica]|uniref:Uncharacterized protein n=1 Tax=Mycena indigotica TaxID=2126181 RepID=A0A8H6T3F5_9AGAR|nr:uncharacterized protein MIND_00408200 [Mycena indigotica]KAF7310341.1 hypothetical protein MIND_00408200 [Mycena indigotica]